MCTFDAERVHHPERIGGHVMHRVRRVHGKAEAMLQALPHHIRHTQLVEMLRQADVAVVEAHNAISRSEQRIHESIGPGDQLHAQAHDEDDSRAVRAADIFDLDGDAVGANFHSNRRSRSHLVAIHFSPASTGAPPCSVFVDGCGRS
jgi:hypothetical protein